MSITISHDTALHALRTLRFAGEDTSTYDHCPMAKPSTWIGRRWSMREFDPEVWRYAMPQPAKPLHIVVRNQADRVRSGLLKNHVCNARLPASSVIWLDEHTSMVSTPLLFVQMAETLTLPELVLLGYELCGTFSRFASDPRGGPVIQTSKPATSVEELAQFVQSVALIPGITLARKAVHYVADHAVSAPEAVLGTMYSLPPEEFGYGMGPVRLNKRISLDEMIANTVRARYPDILFPFAPIGINYDGNDHLDIDGLVRVAQQAVTRAGDEALSARLALANKAAAMRAKWVDDIRRNRQLCTRGHVVLPVTKEDLYDPGSLDRFTRELLMCAHALFGTDVGCYLEPLDDSDLRQGRLQLLRHLLG